MIIEISDLVIKRVRRYSYIALVMIGIIYLLYPGPGGFNLLCRFVPCGGGVIEPRSAALAKTINLSLGVLPIYEQRYRGVKNNKEIEVLSNKFNILNISIEELKRVESKCPDQSKEVKVCDLLDENCLADVKKDFQCTKRGDFKNLTHLPQGPDLSGNGKGCIVTGWDLIDNPYKKSLGKCIIDDIDLPSNQRKDVISLSDFKNLARYYPEIMQKIVEVASKPCKYLPTKEEIEKELEKSKDSPEQHGYWQTLNSLQSARKELQCDVKVKKRETIELHIWGDPVPNENRIRNYLITFERED